MQTHVHYIQCTSITTLLGKEHDLRNPTVAVYVAVYVELPYDSNMYGPIIQPQPSTPRPFYTLDRSTWRNPRARGLQYEDKH
jgi:hypothetical protein